MKRSVLAGVAALVLAGCSSSGSTGAGGGSGGGSGGGTGGAGGGGTPTGTVGYIALTQLENVSGSFTRGGSAAFYFAGPAIPMGALSCTFTTTGGCDISDCFHDGGIPTFDGGAKVSAGDLSVAISGSDGGPPFTRNASTNLYLGNGTGQWWAGGEMVTAIATGGDGGVPAFTASLMTPTRLVITNPVPDGGSVIVTRNSPFVVAWTPGTGTVSVAVQSGTLVGGHSVKAICSTSASTGTITVPATVTNLLLPTTTGYVQVTNAMSTDHAAGAYSVHLSATHSSPTRNATVP